MADLCLGHAVDPSDPSAIEAWLDRSAVPATDRAALRAEADRLLVYRDVVRGNLREALAAALPRTMTRLGPVFDEYFARWLRERGPRTHYLRDVTEELLAFVEPLWPTDPRLPEHAMDLARHEAVQIRVAAKEARPRGEPPALELALDRVVRFIEAIELLSYRFAVHQLSEDPADRTPPVRRDTWLLVYRSPEHELRFLELSALADAILRRLVAGTPLGDAVRSACAERGESLDARVIQGTAELLHDLAERGVLLGSEPKGGTSHGG